MSASWDESIGFSSLPFWEDAIELDHALGDGGSAELATALPATPFGSSDLLFLEIEPQNLSQLSSTVPSTPSSGDAVIPPKLGGRFSRHVLGILRKWLASHTHRPYPDPTELELLQNQTGLNRTQITNWFANARRRGCVRGTRPATPQVQASSTKPMDIIPRPATPAVRQNSCLMTPLERWVDSPPENEPASVGAIARAMTRSTSHSLDHTHDHTLQSPYGMSSASSVRTSNSSEFSGFHSSESQCSLKSSHPPRRRRARRQRRTENGYTPISTMTYQCTFCTETFRTKYDWQRHEKSLHLPLEHWVCALNGPRAPKDGTGTPCCVFCSRADPDDAHIESHYYSACQGRSLEERTFQRKDHLSQHLRLFHGVKYAEWSMSQWRKSLPNIRSRCGFCGLEMNTWSERTEHLAEHFKAGKTMADWQGEWGFDPAVLNIVESAVPPYFIDIERASAVPFAASNVLLCSPLNAYELLKIELECFMRTYFDREGRLPSDDDLQREACRIIFASDASSDDTMFSMQLPTSSSWLRDLIMSSAHLKREAQFGPLRLCSEGRLPELIIKGQDNIFEKCPLEAQLCAFVELQKRAGIMAQEDKMQEKACEIVRRMEKDSTTPNDLLANWLIKLIVSDVHWLSNFKKRTGTATQLSTTIPSNQDSKTLAPYMTRAEHCHDSCSHLQQLKTSNLTAQSPLNPPTRPATFFPGDANFYPWFVRDLTRWVAATTSSRNPNCHVPSDEEIQHQARWIIYGCDDPWNQTFADNLEWLWRFKRDVGILEGRRVATEEQCMQGKLCI